MWQDILAAIALLFVLEGVLPFLSPQQFRKAMMTASQMNDASLRVLGFASMVGGLVLLYVVK